MSSGLSGVRVTVAFFRGSSLIWLSIITGCSDASHDSITRATSPSSKSASASASLARRCSGCCIRPGAEGVVRVSIAPMVGAFVELEESLESRFNLREAIVVETATPGDQKMISREIGAAAADYLLRVLQPQERVVISWGGTVAAMVDAAGSRASERTERTTVIQGLGGLGDPGRESHASDLTRRMALALGGRPVLLPAPGVAGSRKARNAFCGDEQVNRASRWADQRPSL